MKNEDQWKPTKFQIKDGKLSVSRDPKELSLASRLSASMVLDCYNRHLPEHCRGRLLDLGCGKAPFYGAYRPYVDEAYCVDWENSLHGVTHLDQHADLTQPLPLEDDAFDTLLLSSVLEHIPTPESLCREMHRVLRGGGKVLMNVPFLYWVHEAPHDFYRYTEFALRRFFEEAGFRVLVLESTGGAPVVLADLLGKATIGLPIVHPVLTRIAHGSVSLLLKTGLGRKLNRRSEMKMANGYFLVAEKLSGNDGSP